MFRVLILSVVFALGCAGSESKPEKTSTKESDTNSKTLTKKSARGWRWKGKRKECFFVHESKCFVSRKTACKAAGCDDKKCDDDGGAPAQVSCPSKK